MSDMLRKIINQIIEWNVLSLHAETYCIHTVLTEIKNRYQLQIIRKMSWPDYSMHIIQVYIRSVRR